MTILFLVLLTANATAKAAQKAIHKAKSVPNKVHKKVKMRVLGIASWYGRAHQGKMMANGKKFDRFKMTCASKLLPLGSFIRVINLENGKSATLEVTDRGPYVGSRILDLSEAAARQLDCIGKGLCKVLYTPFVDTESAKVEKLVPNLSLD